MKISKLQKLNLQRVSGEGEAGLWQCSLPWPKGRAAQKDLSLDGRPGSALPIGQWHGVDEDSPRRMLISVDGGVGESTPETILFDGSTAGKGSKVAYRVFDQPFEASPDPYTVWHRSQMIIEANGKRVGLALGLRRRDGSLTWWEFTRLTQLEKDDFCETWEMGGTIPWEYNYRGQFPGFANPFLHKHNWLNGSLTVRTYANGVVEIFARHVNARYVDAGLDCEDGVPVIGFFSEELEEEWKQDQTWEGDREEITVSKVPFHVGDVAPLSTSEAPGLWQPVAGGVAWQPYEGAELFGGGPTLQRSGGGFICRSNEGRFIKGMSRTLHFSASFSDRSPRIARFVAPYWWYGVNEELGNCSFLPVRGLLGDWESNAREWRDVSMVPNGFEWGNLPRAVDLVREAELKAEAKKNAKSSDKDTAWDMRGSEERSHGRREPGWEGEIPWGFLQLAYRTGRPDDYQTAITASYYFHDVILEHADKQARMHGYPPPAVSLPMVRVLSVVGLYLETGYHHLLETAEATVEAAWRVHRNSWPRFAVGRDATFARTAIMLYRYTNNRHFLKMGHGVAEAVREVQLPHGPFGDQGGGACIHGWSGYVVKPWMGAMATNVVLDYLELFPDGDGSEQLWEVIRKYVDWLMRERRDPGDGRGRTWAYQHEYADSRIYMEKFSGNPIIVPGEGRSWHQENVGRLLLMASERFGDPSYAEAWAESHFRTPRGRYLDQSLSATLQFLPWVEAHLVRACGETGEPVVETNLFGDHPYGDTVEIENADGVHRVTLGNAHATAK